jgi:putrescine aminotransferase
VEGALKAARIHTGRPGFVGATGGFHGKTFGSLSVSGRDLYRKPFQPLLPDTKHVPFGDATAMAEAVDETTAAVILEVIQGEGGVILPPDRYLREVRRICDERGALLILDEVRTALGRTGAMFASEHYGVIPDIVTMAKALGGGVMPVGAFSAKPEIWHSLFDQNPYLHSSTFGGNPLACAAAIAAIKATIEEDLCNRAQTLGERLVSGLQGVAERYPEDICEVRAKGLLAGIEFKVDDFAVLVITGCGRRGVLVAYSMNNPKVVRVEPPLIISPDELERAIRAIEESVEETARLVAEARSER